MAKKIKPWIKELKKRLGSVRAGSIMTEHVVTTTEDATLADVSELMIRARISGLPVINKKGKIVGIVTANDLFAVIDMIEAGDAVNGEMKPVSNPTVKFAMSTDIIKIRRRTTLDEMVALMKYKNAHTLPVFEGGRMVGVVGRRDIYKNFYAVVRDLY